MTPDPTAVRADAERLDRNWYDEFDCTEEGLSRECVDAIHSVRDAYLALTDSTPLMVEVLVGMGGVENPKSELCYRFGRLCVYADGPPEAWEWTYGNDVDSDVPPWLNPRTAGHLAMLLAMMEGR